MPPLRQHDMNYCLQMNRVILRQKGWKKSYKLTQKQIMDEVDVDSSRKIFRLNLDQYGPYSHSYSRNGRYTILCGQKGHISMIDNLRSKAVNEFHVEERCRDVEFLHNHTLFAVAQQKYAYVYDRDGAEVHQLKHHIEPTALEFLHHHLILASVGNAGFLKYQDVSTGELVAEHRTKLGPCRVLRQNPWNAVMSLGHNNGCVTMWTPNMNEPVVKLLAHKSPINTLCVDRTGTYMATAGADAKLKVWDLRTYKELHEYFVPSPASSIDISQRGLLGVGFRSHALVWKDALTQKATSPYLRHDITSQLVNCLRFRPYEDVLGISHSSGFDSCLVPGAGEPNYDSYAADPFENRKQIREAEVQAALDKLPASMIALDAKAVGSVDTYKEKQQQLEQRKNKYAIKVPPVASSKKKTRGRSKSSRRAAKQQANVITERKERRRQQILESKEEKTTKNQNDKVKPTADKATAGEHWHALSRFK
eukprot:gb/GECG01011299.1/.p1 GENE.gb/GECG01011299.1/~~gb/GECG01011299.1/.p1  ORF type:complete len:478 (+),score=51.45 gb/GECG01011299.1/:1-1434(+)